MSPPDKKGASAPKDTGPDMNLPLYNTAAVNASCLDYEAVDRALSDSPAQIEETWWLDEQAATLRAAGCPAREAVKYVAALSELSRLRESGPLTELRDAAREYAAQTGPTDEFQEGLRLHKQVLDAVEREADGHGNPSPVQVLVSHMALDFVLRRDYLRGLTIRDCANLLGVSHTVFHRRAHRFSVLAGVPLERGKSEDTRIALSLSHRAEFRSVLTVSAAEKGAA